MKLFLQPRVESAPFLLASILGARGYFCLGEEANEYSKKRKTCICLLFVFRSPPHPKKLTFGTHGIQLGVCFCGKFIKSL